MHTFKDNNNINRAGSTIYIKTLNYNFDSIIKQLKN